MTSLWRIVVKLVFSHSCPAINHSRSMDGTPPCSKESAPQFTGTPLAEIDHYRKTPGAVLPLLTPVCLEFETPRP